MYKRGWKYVKIIITSSFFCIHQTKVLTKMVCDDNICICFDFVKEFNKVKSLTR